MKKIIVFCFILSALVPVISQGKEKVIQIRCAHFDPLGAPITRGAEHLKGILEKRTNGRVSMQIFPGGQLVDKEEVILALQQGSIQLTSANIYNFEQYDPAWGVILMPNFINTTEHFMRVMKTHEGQELINRLAGKYNVRILGFEGHVGRGCFFTSSKAIKSFGDLKGMKIRGPQLRVHVEALKATGASVLSIASGELPSAVEQGMVDGIVGVYFVAMKFLDGTRTLPYVTEGPKGQSLFGILQQTWCISDSFWKSMPEDIRDIFQDCVDETVKLQNEWYAETEQELRAKYMAGNTHLTYWTEEDMIKWEEKMSNIIQHYKEVPGGSDLFNAIEKTR